MAIFQEGFLSHLANAVKIPAVVILGGWQPKSICYPDQIGLSGETECAPCFRLKPCLIEKKCMKKIGVDEVLGAVSIIERRIS